MSSFEHTKTRPGFGVAYGSLGARLQVLRRFVPTMALLAGLPVAASAAPLRIVALGDSLTAGYQLPADAAFPAVLEKALRGEGLNVTVANAGVSGDTAQAGLERLDWSVPDGTQGVILELGANDMLRGLDPNTTTKTLQTIIDRLRARKIEVFLAGMLAAPSLGPEYGERFNAIFPALARGNGLPFYPFFLQGVMEDRALRLPDGLHPTAAGVTVMVKGIAPAVGTWLRSLPKAG